MIPEVALLLRGEWTCVLVNLSSLACSEEAGLKEPNFLLATTFSDADNDPSYRHRTYNFTSTIKCRLWNQICDCRQILNLSEPPFLYEMKMFVS